MSRIWILTAGAVGGIVVLAWIVLRGGEEIPVTPGPVPAPQAHAAEKTQTGTTASPLQTAPLVTDVTPEPGRIQGTVKLPTGYLAPDARVRVVLAPPPGQRNYALVASFDEETITDEAGRFVLDVPGGGLYRVIAWTPGYAPAREEGVFPGAMIELTLGTASRIDGRVLDEEGGAGIGGAAVTAKLPSPYTERRLETDADGSFEVLDLPPGLIVLTVDHEEHAPAEPIEREVKPGEPMQVVVRLVRGKRVIGKVFSAGDERPLSGARISVAPREGLTDERGAFSVSGLPARPLSVRVTAEGYLPQERSVNLGGSRHVAETEFRLSPGASLFGQVTNATGDPMAGVDLKLFQTWDRNSNDYMWEDWTTRHLTVLTDSFGRYEFRGISPKGWGYYALRARHPAHPDIYSNGIQIKRPDERIPLDIRFGDGAEVTGTVLNPDREPLAGCRVSLRPSVQIWTNQKGQPPIVTGTESDGTFRFRGVAGGTYTLRVEARGASPVVRRGVKVESHRNAAHQEVILVPGQPLRGLVTDRDGQPVEQVTVNVQTRKGNGSAVTLEDGSFHMESVPEGPYSVRANREGYASYHKNNVMPDENGAITIELATQAVVRGRVLDDDTEEPIRAFRLVFTSKAPTSPGRRPRGWTRNVKDRDGRFTVSRPDAEYGLEVQAKGYVRGEVESIVFAAGQEIQEIELRLRRGGAIEGYVKDQAGVPVSGVNVYWRASVGDDDRYVKSVNSEADGYFLVNDLDAGDYDLAFKRAGYPIATRDQIPAGSAVPTWVDANLERMTSVAFEVKAPRRKKNERPAASPWSNRHRRPRGKLEVTSLDHQTVHLASAGRGPLRKTVYRAVTGRTWNHSPNLRPLTITELYPGRYRVRATYPGLPPQVQVIQLHHGIPRTLSFDFRPPEVTPAAAGEEATQGRHR